MEKPQKPEVQSGVNSPPNEKDVLLKLIEVQTTRFNYTRDIEFRVNIGIWAAMITGAFAAMGKERQIGITTDEGWWTAFGIGAALFVLHWGWMRLIASSQQTDSDLIKDYRDRLVPPKKPDEIAHPGDESPRCCKWLSTCLQFCVASNWRQFGWLICEVGITAVLYWAIFAVLWERDKTKPPSEDTSTAIEARSVLEGATR